MTETNGKGSANGQALLQVKDLKKHFQIGRGATLKAVDGISLDIKKGETFGLVGESGCGKSTTARLLMHLVPVDRGTPIPTLGFNKDVAWTHTVTAARHFTFYQLKLDPADPTADPSLDDASARALQDRVLDAVRAALGGGADLVLSDMAPNTTGHGATDHLRIMALADRAKAPILFGSPALRYYPDRRPYLLNSAYLLAADGTILGRYDKHHLVPFGEYIPLKSSLLFFLDKLVEGIGDFEAGPGGTTLIAD